MPADILHNFFRESCLFGHFLAIAGRNESVLLQRCQQVQKTCENPHEPRRCRPFRIDRMNVPYLFVQLGGVRVIVQNQGLKFSDVFLNGFQIGIKIRNRSVFQERQVKIDDVEFVDGVGGCDIGCVNVKWIQENEVTRIQRMRGAGDCSCRW